MPCLEPNKNLSEDAKKVLKLLSKLKSATRQEIADEAGMDTPLVSRKLRELMGKGAVIEKDGKYQITEDGVEAAKKI